MSSGNFHPILEYIDKNIPGKVNKNSKAADFIYLLENESHGKLTTSKLNDFIDLMPATEVAFAKSVNRTTKIQAVCSWIRNIFERKEQLTQNDGVVAPMEFTAADVQIEVQKAVSTALEVQRMEQMAATKAQDETIAELKKLLGSKRKSQEAETQKLKELSVKKSLLVSQLEKLKSEMHALSEKDHMDSASDSSSDSDVLEVDAPNNFVKKNRTGSFGGGSANDMRVEQVTSHSSNFTKTSLDRIVVTSFDANMKSIELAQSIAAISAIMYKSFAIVPSIKKSHFL